VPKIALSAKIAAIGINAMFRTFAGSETASKTRENWVANYDVTIEAPIMLERCLSVRAPGTEAHNQNVRPEHHHNRSANL
jgi:hypothetical protein